MQGHFSICCWIATSPKSKAKNYAAFILLVSLQCEGWQQLRGLSWLWAEAGGWSPLCFPGSYVSWYICLWAGAASPGAAGGTSEGQSAWLLVSAQLGVCISRRRVPGAEGEMGTPRGLLWPAGTEQHQFRLMLWFEVSCLDLLRFRGGASDSFQWEDREHAGVF